MRPFVPLLAWAAGAIALAVVVLSVVRGQGPLDDPDPAQQRPGFLTSAAGARTVTDLRLPGVVRGRPALVLFDRQRPDSQRLQAALGAVPARIQVVLVISMGGKDRLGRAGVFQEPSERASRVVGLDQPKDGGPPIGYAMIDGQARVRYVTLDPGYLDHAFELALIAKAVA